MILKRLHRVAAHAEDLLSDTEPTEDAAPQFGQRWSPGPLGMRDVAYL